MNTIRTGVGHSEALNAGKTSRRPRQVRGKAQIATRGTAFLVATGLATALWACPAEAGFIAGTSASLTATDNLFGTAFINGSATVGASNQFSGTQNLGGLILDWTARVDANSLTISLTTSQGAAAFGSPRDTFAFSSLSLTTGTNLNSLALVSESNFDAVISSTASNSVVIGINSFDTRGGVLSAAATFALPVAAVPEPASGVILGTLLLGFGLSRRRTAGKPEASPA